MNEYQPMNCNLYGYLEIACMRGYRLDIELKDMSGMPVRYVMDWTDFRVVNSSFRAIPAFFSA